jgi:hypothetical protein
MAGAESDPVPLDPKWVQSPEGCDSLNSRYRSSESNPRYSVTAAASDLCPFWLFSGTTETPLLTALGSDCFLSRPASCVLWVFAHRRRTRFAPSRYSR